MKLIKKVGEVRAPKPDARTSADHTNPPGITPLEDHPWKSEEVARLWHRPGSQRGVAEVVIETAAGKRICCCLKQLPGFYESAVKRTGRRIKF